MKRVLTEQELERRRARQQLEAMGINPYPYRWEVTAHAAEILQNFDDARHQPREDGPAPEPYEVSIAGRIMTRRIMGKAAFFDLQDETGRIQVYVRRQDLPEGFYDQVFKKLLDIGDIVGVEASCSVRAWVRSPSTPGGWSCWPRRSVRCPSSKSRTGRSTTR
nr:OB-fold nucleic acid binding domain-containing protein [Rhodothermus marinus]